MPEQNDAAPNSGKNRRDGPKGTGGSGGTGQQAVGREQVIAYLRRHPEFFQEHPDLLDSLYPPAREQGEGVVDFQHAMVQRLRSEVQELVNLRNDLLSVGRANMTSQDRVHRAALAVLEATSFEQFIERVTTDLAVILDLAFCSEEN